MHVVEIYSQNVDYLVTTFTSCILLSITFNQVLVFCVNAELGVIISKQI